MTTHSAAGADARAAEITDFLRNLHGLNMSIVQQLSPILEDRLGIDLRLYFIMHIIEGGAVHPGAIALEIKLPNSLVTKHLDQLAHKQMLRRSIDRADSRRIRVALTDHGHDIMRRADAMLADLIGQRLARLDDAKRSSFIATLVELANDPPCV